MSYNWFGKLTPEQVSEAEKETGLKFPEDYKEFLMKTNGGYLDLDSDDEHGFHVDPIDEEDIWIDSFFGVGESAANYLINYNKEYGDETNGCIIIGDTLSHGLILYDYNGVFNDEQVSAICFWDDTRAYDVSSDEQNLYYLAKDINGLLKRANIKID